MSRQINNVLNRSKSKNKNKNNNNYNNNNNNNNRAVVPPFIFSPLSPSQILSQPLQVPKGWPIGPPLGSL